MSDFIPHETSSEESIDKQPAQLDSLLHKLVIKCLRSSKNILAQQLSQNIANKYQQLMQKDEIVSFLQYLIYELFNQVDKLVQSAKIDIVHEDYQVLEEAVQKSQAQIRKHIKIEHQLKIYLDALQQKSEQLQKKLEVQQNRYNQLYECMKQIEEERKQLLKKMEKLQLGRIEKIQSKQKIRSNSNFSTINEQLYKDYFGGRKPKATKGKHVIDKLNARKLSDKKSCSNLNIIDRSIQINLSNNIVVNKKGSYDQNISKPAAGTHNASVSQLTKTLQMKQHNIANFQRRPKRKMSKYKTENGELIQKREQRSNSVCN